MIIKEPARDVPVLLETDVVVAGGGPAGVAAALAAARNGARTALVERQFCLGGMATSGMMNRLGPYHDQEKMIVGGIPWEILERLVALGAALMPAPCPRDDPDRYWAPFDPEAMKIVLDEMAQEAGVTVLFDSLVVGVVPGGRGVIVEGKLGRQAILAKVIVDASGDGDVAAAAGAPFEKGRPSDGAMQPMTLLFKVCKLDRDRTKQFLAMHKEKLLRGAQSGGEKLPSYIGPGSDNLLRSDETYFNINHVFGADGTDVKELSKAAVEARRQIWQCLAFARKNVPGYEHSYLSATAAQLGVRETRRVVGEYALTGDDVLSARQFEDAIARYACWIDIHTLGRGKDAGAYASKGPNPGTSYGIPYRCLLPKAVEHVLVAGRCFSSTHEGLASARMIPCCMAMGQAAGTAAALSIRAGVPPRRLNVKDLQQTLRDQGVRI